MHSKGGLQETCWSSQDNLTPIILTPGTGEGENRRI